MKAWYESKTIWFNILAGLVLIASAFGFAGFEMDETYRQIAEVLIVVINLILRFSVTKTGIIINGLKG